MALQTCDLALGRVEADASCSKGYLCCDASCAAAVAQPTFQVTLFHLPAVIMSQSSCHIVDPSTDQLSGILLSYDMSDVQLTTDVNGLQNNCVPGCAENAIGLIFYRLVLTNMATLNMVDILMACMYRLLGMAVTFDPPAVSCLAISVFACMAARFFHRQHVRLV